MYCISSFLPFIYSLLLYPFPPSLFLFRLLPIPFNFCRNLRQLLGTTALFLLCYIPFPLARSLRPCLFLCSESVSLSPADTVTYFGDFIQEDGDIDK